MKGQTGERMVALAKANRTRCGIRMTSKPIGEKAKMGKLIASAIQKRLRMKPRAEQSLH
jgi:hypothetical protein